MRSTLQINDTQKDQSTNSTPCLANVSSSGPELTVPFFIYLEYLDTNKPMANVETVQKSLMTELNCSYSIVLGYAWQSLTHCTDSLLFSKLD